MKIVKDENYLSKACEPIQDLEWAAIKMRLFLGMKSRSDAIGLACNQIGINKRGFVVRSGSKLLFFKNPQIILKGKVIKHNEKCLSLPKDYNVPRNSEVVITDDINGTLIFKDYMACVIQHEYDHINGILIKHKGE